MQKCDVTVLRVAGAFELRTSWNRNKQQTKVNFKSDKLFWRVAISRFDAWTSRNKLCTLERKETVWGWRCYLWLLHEKLACLLSGVSFKGLTVNSKLQRARKTRFLLSCNCVSGWGQLSWRRVSQDRLLLSGKSHNNLISVDFRCSFLEGTEYKILSS